MENSLHQFNPHPSKAPIKMGNAPYLSSPLDHFLHLEIFAPSVHPLDLELIEISIFNENNVYIISFKD
jgi:hypothetical protein